MTPEMQAKHDARMAEWRELIEGTARRMHEVHTSSVLADANDVIRYFAGMLPKDPSDWWGALDDSQRRAWIDAAGLAYSEAWQAACDYHEDLLRAVEYGVARTDNPHADLLAKIAGWRQREMTDEHYATTRRAGVVMQPPPAPEREDVEPTWVGVLRDVADRLPDDPQRHLLFADMHERMLMGKHKYGVHLQPGNGRNSLVDAYQEALDLCVYLKNAVEEMGVSCVPSPDTVVGEYDAALFAAYRIRGMLGDGGHGAAAPRGLAPWSPTLASSKADVGVKLKNCWTCENGNMDRSCAILRQNSRPSTEAERRAVHDWQATVKWERTGDVPANPCATMPAGDADGCPGYVSDAAEE